MKLIMENKKFLVILRRSEILIKEYQEQVGIEKTMELLSEELDIDINEGLTTWKIVDEEISVRFI